VRVLERGLVVVYELAGEHRLHEDEARDENGCELESADQTRVSAQGQAIR